MSKTLVNGVLEPSGEPTLSHEDWVERSRKIESERLKEAAAKANKRTGKSATKATDAEEPTGDDRVFHGHKLSVYRRQVGDKTGDERRKILMDKNEGIGQARADEIAAALDSKA